MELFKLMTSDGGSISIQEKDLTKQEAQEMRDQYEGYYPDQDWWIMPHNESDYYQEPKRYSSNAVDGWEDLFNR